MVLGAYVALRMTAGFFEKFIFTLNWGKWGRNRVYEFTGKCSHYFSLNLVYNKSSYNLLYSCANPIFGKNQVPEISTKMLPANQIAGFLN